MHLCKNEQSLGIFLTTNRQTFLMFWEKFCLGLVEIFNTFGKIFADLGKFMQVFCANWHFSKSVWVI